MRIKQNNKKISFFIFLILTAIFLFALLPNTTASEPLKEDFSITNEKSSLSLCNCNIAQTSVIITNTGDITSTYKIFITKNEVSDWVSIPEDYFSLIPGESKKVDIFINVPCDSKGDFKADFKVKTLFELEKTFSQDFSVNQCLNAVVYSTDTSKSTCPCKPKTFNFKLSNTGEFVESYKFSIKDNDLFKDYSDYFTISEDVIILGPNQEKEFYVTANLPCWIYGKKEFILSIDGEKSKMRTDVPFNLDVLPCYDYELKGDSYFNVCNDVKNQTINLKINNGAEVSNNYKISVSGVGFIKPTEEKVFAFKNEEVDVKFNIKTDNKIKPGIYNATITTTSEKGGVVREKPITINVEDCYSANVNIEPYLSAVNCERNTYVIKINNTGTKGATFNLDLTAPNFMSLKENSIYVYSGKTGYGEIKADIPCESKHDAYKIYVSVNHKNIDKITKKSILEITSVEDAHMPSIKFNSKELENTYEKKEIQITITNNGIRKSDYELSIEGADWIYLNETYVSLEPKESEEITLFVNPDLFVEEGKYWFDIKAKLVGTDIVYTKTDKITLRTVPLSEKIKNIAIMYVLPYGIVIILLILLILFLIWLIKKIKKKISEKKKKDAENAKKELEKKRKQKIKPLIAKDEIKKQKKETNKKGFWSTLLAILLILLVLAGIGLVAFNFDKIQNSTKNAWNSLTNSTEIDDAILNKVQVYINRTGLEGTGNNILIGDQGIIDIPIIISNPTEYKVIFSVNLNEDADWIESNKEVILLEPNQTETLNLKVNTSKIYGNDYEINVQSRILEENGTTVEKVNFNIISKPDYKTYAAYAFAGLLALLIILILGWAIISMYSKLKETKETKKYNKITKKKIKNIEAEETFEEYYKKRKAFKIFLFVIVLLVIVSGVLFLGFFLSENIKSESNLFENKSELLNETTNNQIEENKEKSIESIEPLIFINKESLKGAGNSIEVYGKKTVLIPITIKNPTDKRAIYYLGLPENINWATLSSERVVIGANSFEIVELEVVPSLMKEGKYELNLMIQLQGEETIKVEKLNVVLSNENKWSWIYYLYYIFIGVIVLAIILLVINKITNKKKKSISN